MFGSFISANLILLGPTLGPTELILVLVILVIPLLLLRIPIFFRKRSEGKKKSHLIGIILTLLLGPLGLAYSTRGGWWDVAVLVGGVVWIILAFGGILMAMPAAISIASLAISIASLVVSFVAVRSYNRKLAQENESSSPVSANV